MQFFELLREIAADEKECEVRDGAERFFSLERAVSGILSCSHG